MPFIKKDRREEIAKLGVSACKDVGDICFVFYGPMVSIWKKDPCWTTAHNIYKMFVLDQCDFYWAVNDTLIAKFELSDIKTGCDLAWQVFFQNYVMPYEKEKEALNGTI